jgi:P pilus assembly chaperone PapD
MPLLLPASHHRRRAHWTLAAILFAVGLGWTGAGRAEIALNQIIVDFVPGSPPVHDVEVRNLDEEREFVEVTVNRIGNPGGWPSERQTATNPAELGLIATPTKVVLPPKGAHVLRLIATQPNNEAERIYRVAVVPKVPEVADSRSGVKVVVGYEMLVIVRPKEMRPALQAQRTGKRLTLKNVGNTNVLVPTVRQCRGSDCKATAGIRVYVGRTETIELPEDMAVEAVLAVAGKSWTERYP